MGRFFLVALVGSGILLGSLAAKANYLLVTANGTVTSARDETNYLGYGAGSTSTGELGSLLGESVSISWLLDLDLAGTDILGGAQAGRGVYTGGSCPGANLWLTTLGATLGGQGLNVTPTSATSVQQCGSAEMWDQALNDRFDSTAVSNETWGQSSGTLDDGSTVTQSTYLRSAASILEVDLDFIQGIDLDQSFVWTQGAGEDTNGVGNFARQTSIENCDGAVCTSADLIDFELIVSFSTLSAQVVQSVPEPGAVILLCFGLLLMAALDRPKRSPCAARRR